MIVCWLCEFQANLWVAKSTRSCKYPLQLNSYTTIQQWKNAEKQKTFTICTPPSCAACTQTSTKALQDAFRHHEVNSELWRSKIRWSCFTGHTRECLTVSLSTQYLKGILWTQCFRQSDMTSMHHEGYVIIFDVWLVLQHLIKSFNSSIHWKWSTLLPLTRECNGPNTHVWPMTPTLAKVLWPFE